MYTVKVGRPQGTSIQRKAIRESEYQDLIRATQGSNHLQRHVSERHRQSITLLYYLGLRVGELLTLTVGDLRKAIETGECQLEGSKTKTKKPRLLQFSPTAVEAVKLHFAELLISPAHLDRHLVFHATSPTAPLNKANFTLRLNEFIHETLDESYSSHSFRQGLITDMIVKHNLPLVVAQSYIGHRSMMTTARYTRASEEDTHRAICMVR